MKRSSGIELPLPQLPNRKQKVSDLPPGASGAGFVPLLTMLIFLSRSSIMTITKTLQFWHKSESQRWGPSSESSVASLVTLTQSGDSSE